MGNKYGNEITYVHRSTLEYCEKDDPYALRFDSFLEAQTYRILASRSDLLVSLQYKIQVSSSTERFGAIYWDCDFRVFHKSDSHKPHLNVEAKGLAFTDFILKLHLLDRCYPREVDNLIIVVANDDKIPRSLSALKQRNQIVKKSDLYDYLHNKGY